METLAKCGKRGGLGATNDEGGFASGHGTALRGCELSGVVL